jgi:hypothetical protein
VVSELEAARAAVLSTIPLFDGSAITKFDVLPASRLL